MYVQFKVVFSLETLLADLALEPPTNAMSGEVTSKVSLTWKNLLERKKICITFKIIIISGNICGL